MAWDNTSPSRRARRNRRIRGTGTWADQGRRLDLAQHKRLRREMGSGLWSDKNRQLDRARRQRERNLRRNTDRRGRAVATAVVFMIVSAVLLISASTRATGVLILLL